MDEPQGRRTVLVVNVDEALFLKVAPLLNRQDFELDRFPRAAAALDLVAHVPLDVLLVRFPLPDVSLQQFLDAVRAETSPCRQSPLLLLAAPDLLGEAEQWIGRGANRLPIRGEGTVARRTTAGRESVRGIGIRFASFDRDGALRLQRYLRELSR